MKIFRRNLYTYYLADNVTLDDNKCGKWMCHFNNLSFAENICQNAVINGIVEEAKHSNNVDGVCFFYLNIDDIEGHKCVIEYFLKNKLIPKTKKGRYYNIPFKLDEQTRKGEYAEFGNFTPKLTLSDFVNLDTGEFLTESD